MPELDARRKEFEVLDAQVLDISVDSIPSHIAWQKKEIGMMRVPLCADFYPHADVTQAFGILREGAPVPGISERAAFIVDKAGKIAFARIYPIDQLPNVEELLQAVSKNTSSRISITSLPITHTPIVQVEIDCSAGPKCVSSEFTTIAGVLQKAGHPKRFRGCN